MHLRCAVVTGVSSGVGLATARVLASHGVHVFGSVRKAADAERLKSELREQFTPLLFDVTDVDAVRAFAPLLGTERARTGNPGRIVNISSVAGRISAPFLGAYAASKRALEGMSHSLRRELLLYDIDVIVINPGSVVTPIWDKAETNTPSRYAATDYAPFLHRFLESALRSGRSGLPAETVGEVVWTALTARRPRTSYPVVRRRLRNWTIPLPCRIDSSTD